MSLNGTPLTCGKMNFLAGGSWTLFVRILAIWLLGEIMFLMASMARVIIGNSTRASTIIPANSEARTPKTIIKVKPKAP